MFRYRIRNHLLKTLMPYFLFLIYIYNFCIKQGCITMFLRRLNDKVQYHQIMVCHIRLYTKIGRKKYSLEFDSRRQLILHFIAVKHFCVINICVGYFKAPLFFIWCCYRILCKLEVTWSLKLVHRLNKWSNFIG